MKTVEIIGKQIKDICKRFSCCGSGWKNFMGIPCQHPCFLRPCLLDYFNSNNIITTQYLILCDCFIRISYNIYYVPAIKNQ